MFRPVVRCYLLSSGVDAEELKGRIRRRLPSLLAQVVSSRLLGSETVAELLVWQTLYAKSSASLMAKTPEMDLLLRVAGTTQISEAIALAGAKRGEASILIASGSRGDLARLTSEFRPGKRLQRRRLTPPESMLIEKAATLNATRG